MNCIGNVYGCSVEWLTSLCNLIIAEVIPDDWKSGVLLPVFKGKGDPMECWSYRAIVNEHSMKVTESVFEQRIRETVKNDTREEWLISAAIAMYQGISAVYRTAYGCADVLHNPYSSHNHNHSRQQVPVARMICTFFKGSGCHHHCLHHLLLQQDPERFDNLVLCYPFALETGH